MSGILRPFERTSPVAAQPGTKAEQWLAIAMIAVALLTLQVSSGAYQSEFTAAPDEPGHFISALAVYDYVTQRPSGRPVDWAGQYYLHYPFVAIGHWPPFYFVWSAIWWLLTGPSRASLLVLQWLTGTAALALLYGLARKVLGLPAAVLAVCAAALTPVFHESLGHTMSDTLCFLFGLLFVQALAGSLEGQPGAAARTALWFLLAALTKGTAAGLVAAAGLAWAACPNRTPVRMRRVAPVLAVVMVPIGAYLWMGRVIYNGGMNFAMPWRIDRIEDLAGWGLLLLAAAGIRREPLSLAAASTVAGMVVLSFFVRAMRTERHWIIALPAIVLLAGTALSRLRPRWILIPLSAAAVWTFPLRFQQHPVTPFRAALEKIQRPARMLVSSTGNGEGEWTAMTAASEARPGSVVVRASQVLWLPLETALLTPDTPSVLRRLDELAIGYVILHSPKDDPPKDNRTAAHRLLRNSIAANPAWRPCGAEPAIEIYCRAAPPAAARRPLRVHSRAGTFEERLPRPVE